MTSWANRPREVKYLLNPAFCGAVLASCVSGYESKAKGPMPLTLVFLCLPIVLHGDTRRALPKSANANLNKWLLQNRVVTVGFSKRVKSLLPYVREALLFATSREVLEISAEGVRALTKHSTRKRRSLAVLEPYIKAAKNLGIWLADSGSPSTVYSLWGVAP